MKTAKSRKPARPAAAPQPRPQPRLILVVDDFHDNREMYAQCLAYAGYRVEEAQDGHQALEKAFALKPDLILMDLALPGIDGWEATRRLKGDPRTKDIPIIALTGHALVGFSDGARKVGCDGFVAKPCLPDQLIEEVGRFLTARPRTKSGGGIRWQPASEKP